jgi:predicted lactoylglutathione lyase
MIDHISLKVGDITKSKEFYTKALAPLGYKVHMEFPEWKTVGLGAEKPDLWISQTESAQASHIALMTSDKASVDAFYKAATEAGGKDNGAPGYRKDYSPGYYAAFVHDPDGHNLEVVFHDPNPME